MVQDIYSRSVTILKRFTHAAESSVLVLYEPGFTSPFDLLQTTRYYGFITDLRLLVNINSIDEQELPDLDATSSRNERLTAFRDMEWKSRRKELALYLEASGQPACKIASISLLNRSPYYHVNLVPYFTDNAIINVGNDARILGQIVNAGYGLLEPNDEVVVFGSVKEEVTTLPESPRDIQFAQPFSWTVGTSSILLLPSNPSRLQATFVNHHASAKIYLNYGATAQQGLGICLMPNGGSYEINQTNPYFGVISAVSSSANATLSGLEAV